jgi:hypothetical protein
VIVAYRKHYPGICVGGLRKPHNASLRRAGVPAMIRTKHTPVYKYKALPLPHAAAVRLVAEQNQVLYGEYYLLGYNVV